MGWQQEIQKVGTKSALLSRLIFHKNLDLDTISRYTGLCANTIRKHMRALVTDERAVEISQDKWEDSFKRGN